MLVEADDTLPAYGKDNEAKSAENDRERTRGVQLPSP
jgi:hypothetical protein